MENIMEQVITSGVCESTTGGWEWYCDAHDTHGNADSKEEAVFVAKSHAKFWKKYEDCDIYSIDVTNNITRSI